MRMGGRQKIVRDLCPGDVSRRRTWEAHAVQPLLPPLAYEFEHPEPLGMVRPAQMA
jgi:hypothetical protein